MKKTALLVLLLLAGAGCLVWLSVVLADEPKDPPTEENTKSVN